MMNPVHPRRHDDEVQKSLQRDRQSPVGMVKECRRFERDEENNQKNWPDTEERHGEGEEPRREKHLTEMKPGRRAHVEVEIGMMNIVKTPEEGRRAPRPGGPGPASSTTRDVDLAPTSLSTSGSATSPGEQAQNRESTSQNCGQVDERH